MTTQHSRHIQLYSHRPMILQMYEKIFYFHNIKYSTKYFAKNHIFEHEMLCFFLNYDNSIKARVYECV